MLFKVRPNVFDDAALADLRGCADHFLGLAGRDRSSLGHFVADAAARTCIVAAARRFYASELPGLFAERYGTIPTLNLAYTTIRLQEPNAVQTQVGWHLDLNFMGDQAPFLVAWVPLEDVGVTRIGLEVCVPTSTLDFKPLLGLWTRRQSEGKSLVFTDQELAEMFGPGTCQARALKLAAGSAALFDQFVLHRTQLLPGATDSRRSFEFRMADLDRLPETWNKRAGLFCRLDETAPDGVEFLIKRAGEPYRTIQAAEMDTLDVRYGA